MISRARQHSGRVAVRICGSIASLQSHLVQTQLTGLHEEIWIKLHAAIGIGVDTDHPSFEEVRIELVIPGAVQAIRHVHALAVSADVNHLWTAQKPAVVLGMSFFACDAADLDLTDELWIEWIRNIVLMKLACSPAGD